MTGELETTTAVVIESITINDTISIKENDTISIQETCKYIIITNRAFNG
jgi:hypothetical protein